MRFLILVMCFIPLSLRAADLSVRDGWAVHKTDKPYAQLVKDTRASVKAHGMFVVTQAGPTAAAAKRGITIPGNRVIGVFNNDFAVKVLGTSTAAMIEAPIRLYVTENANKTATLSYKTPTFVFAPYKEDGGAELMTLAEELDSIFAKIAKDAQN
ncbi:DUF302 domain-containing protein [Ascidiaceihabitans sp.]|uniref:DUF302 domain-containing protein n=1 Tax=Ascidiaceihabitans sp. TaxID=1872644 RepID=UPI003297B7DC